MDSKFVIGDWVWVMHNGRPVHRMVYKVIFRQNQSATGYEVFYKLTKGTLNAGTVKNIDLPFEEEEMFSKKADLKEYIFDTYSE